MIRSLKLLFISLLCASIFAGCQRRVGGGYDPKLKETQNISEDLKDFGENFEANAFSCVPAAQPESAVTKRLAKTAIENSIQGIILARLSSSASEQIIGELEDSFSLIPDDQIAENGFTTSDNSVSQAFVSGLFYVGKAVAQKLSSPLHISNFVGGSCASQRTEPCIRDFISDLGLQVFRRPLKPAEIDEVFQVYENSEKAEPFEDVIQFLFLSPHFLFRLEYEDIDREVVYEDAEKIVFKLSAYELAAKLAITIWESSPDVELLQKASSGELLYDGVFRAQAKRMLNDPKAKPVIQNFYENWFGTNRESKQELDRFDARVMAQIENLGIETPQVFGRAVREEAIQMFAYYTWHAPESERKLSSILTSPYSFTTSEDLSRIYGVSTWDGNFDRLVKFPSEERDRRLGVLNRAINVYNKGAMSRPILTGVEVLDHILCDGLPSPEDNAAPEDVIIEDDMSSREVTEALTEVPGTSCVGCHSSINPIGFSFLHIGSFGELRDRERLLHIDDGGLIARPHVDSSAQVSLSLSSVQVEHGGELALEINTSARAHRCFAKKAYAWANRRNANESVNGCGLQEVYEKLDERKSSTLFDVFLAAVTDDPQFRVRARRK